MNWSSFENEQSFLEHFNSSKEPFAIFKHSSRCSISAVAKSRVSLNWVKYLGDTPIYLIEVIPERALSNKVEEITAITHQSPQLIVVKNGKVVHSTSHLSISAKTASTYI